MTDIVPNEVSVNISHPMRNYMSSERDEFVSYLKRSQKIVHMTWTTAMFGYQNSWNTFALWQSVNSVLAEKFANFAYISGKVKYKFLLTGQPFSYGLMNMSVEPIYQPSPTTGKTWGIKHMPAREVRSFILPHVEIIPSVQQEYEITLPVISPQGMWGRNLPGDHRLSCNVINPLASANATAPGTLTICVYMNFEEVQLHAPTLTSERRAEGILSAPLAKLANVARGFSSVPQLGPYATVIETASSSLSKIFEWIGYSKPRLEDKQCFIMNQTVPPYTTINGRFPNQKLCNDENNQISHTPESHGAGDKDEVLLHNIIKKWGYYSSYQITTVMASGTPIFAANGLPIHPRYCCPLSISTDLNYIELTPIAHVAAMFSWLSGPLKFKFQVVASSMQRATIHIFFSPTRKVAPTLDECIAKLTGTTININGTTETFMDIPYQAVQPHVMSFYPELATASNLAVETDLGHTWGYLYAFVANPVMNAGGTSPIYLNVFLAGSEENTFSCPTTTNMGYWARPATDAKWGLLMTSSAPATEESLLVRTMGEKITSFKQLVSKMKGTYKVVVGTTIDNNILWHMPIYSIPPGTAGYLMNFANAANYYPVYTPYKPWNWNFLSWIDSAFVGRKGSMRISARRTKVNYANAAAAVLDCKRTDETYMVLDPNNGHCNVKPVTMLTGEVPIYDINNSLKVDEVLQNFDYMSIQNVNQHGWNDTEVPFYCPWYYMPTAWNSPQNNYASLYFSDQPSSTDTAAEYSALYGAGDDYSWCFYRGMPLMGSTPPP